MKIALICLVRVSAYVWPDDPEYIRAVFGQGSSGYFERGLLFEGNSQRIKTWEGGEVIWSSGTKDLTSESYVVLEHQGGFRSVYQGVTSRPNLGKTIPPGDWIGYADNDTWRFQIIDIRCHRTINPVELLPVQENDSPKPQLEPYLRQGNQLYLIQNELVIAPGNWSIAIDTVFWGRVPTKLLLYWGENRLSSVSFDSLVEKDGIIVMGTPAPLPYTDVYDEDGRFMIPDISLPSLDGGQDYLKIVLEQSSGSSYVYSWKLRLEEN